MATGVGWNMFLTEARCYLSERILKVPIGLLWLWLLACTLITVSEPLASLPWFAIITALFILAFRLWDDLADLDYDRRHLPPRCLTRSPDVQPFLITLWFQLLALAALLFYFAGGMRTLAFLGLVLAFFIIYRITDKRAEWRPLRVPLVLAKYPAFVLLLADAPGDSTALLVAVGAYLPPLLDEVWSTGPSMFLPAMTFLGMAILSWIILTT